MSEDTTRRRFLTAAGSGVAAALAGCSGNQPDEQSTEAETDTPESTSTATATPEPERQYTGGTLQLASNGPVQTLDPINAKGSGAGYNQYNGTLMTFENGDLPPVAGLATDYEVSEDGRTYTFQLREGVRFHNGDELTAQDFVYSWERLAGAEETRNADDIVGDTFAIDHEKQSDMDGVSAYIPGTLAVEAVDDYTFEFTMATAFTGTMSQIASGTFAPIPEGSVAYPKDYEDHEGVDGLMWEGEYEYNEYFSTQGDGPYFAGVGPFQIDSWSKGDAITLSAFEDYYGEGPYIDEIVYTVIGNQQTRFSRFKNGNLDVLLNGMPTAAFNSERRSIDRDRGTYRTGTYELDNGETVNYGEAPALDTDYLVFNCARTPKPVRQAIAYLINQERISQDVYKGLQPSAYHLTPPGAFMAREGENPGENYNKHYQDGHRNQLDRYADGYPYGVGEARIGEAQRVMEEAGYGENERAEVEFTVFSGDGSWDSIAQTLRDKATAAYIDINIVKADFGTIIGQALDGSMDMFSLGDGMEWPESDNFLRFIPPYDNPSGMFTRWTYQVVCSEVDFDGDGAETVGANVYEQLDGDFPEDHVKVNTDGNQVRVAIENVTPNELESALDAAGYSHGGAESTQAPFDPLMPRSDRQWDTYLENRGPSDEAVRARDEVYYFQEEVNWAAVQELPLVHSITQRLWQDRVNVRMAGTMVNQTFNTLTLEDQDGN
ncbi:ABC transporter substrate-binding protein [Halobaculum magnesiiphilum]|uniref:ABC transporter substrate-binding protein n=1 Tax=Halobaculum magnesiiphilum TaxID=1017351 RepID=A0A8T8WEX1_9EURY|nr:ABC transporter substrate-binding protein [Halobaculum magnesiiphilum]QZP38398.1 ABC transporter substrate-binding protein [Halobaculum magnesiiphilum]